ncbi:chondroitin sulfate proteoglycan 4 [Bombina bombina]|uniref:chondroitin sulfate proteoglycan 4 n=1 Tax=Bombina bombina TaxID=8345 RepID=UPI00235A564D|nr:chondroitin sulfate proteoglycan 4 [Bombina bombina]
MSSSCSTMAGGHWLLQILLLLAVTLHNKGTRGQISFESSWHSRLQLTFTTSQSTGLLFLADGETQYLIVELLNGTLRARLERGVGESMLTSSSGLRLNSLEDHNVDLVVTETQMALTFNNFTSSVDLPGPPKKLHLKHGLFLGGIGQSKIAYLNKEIPRFHGCILEAKFDNADLLSSSYPLAEFHGEQENCPLEDKTRFAGTFSFLGPRSYLMFSTWNVSNYGSLDLILKTSRPGRAPLIYHSGSLKSYFYIEIAGGYLHGTLDTGESVVTIQNTVYVSDSQPHKIQILVDDSEFQLKVDNFASRVPIYRLGYGWDLQGNLYLGGVDDITLAKMREDPLGHLFIDDMEYRSFTGCFSGLMINSVKMKMQDALTSKDVTVGCQEYEYDDYTEYEEVSTSGPTTAITLMNSTTTPLLTSIDSIKQPCILNAKFPNLTSLLSTQTLTVKRGGTSVLEWRHIHPTMELSQVGIRPSQVVFSVVSSGEHGQVDLQIPGADARRKFTLLDVTNHRVSYVHDGSHSSEDELIFEVSVPSGVKISECLRKGQIYHLPISILPSSAAPILVFPKGQTVGIQNHGKRILSTDFIQVSDMDTPCDQLTIYINESSPNGHVELQYKPDGTIHEFSCRDLVERQVVFIHKSGTQAQLTLQAGDRTSRSSSALLTFFAFEPNVSRVHNTGLVVSQGSSGLITPLNFSLITNADSLGLEILYQLTSHPKFGEVQKMVTKDEWKMTENFTQSDLQKSKVRYFSTVSEMIEDELKEELIIQAQLGQQIVSNHTFLVKVKNSNEHMIKINPLRVGRRRKLKLTKKELQVDTREQDINLASITYMILQPPRKGNLELNGQRLSEGSRFTQEDLQSGRLSYACMIRNTRETEDKFLFRVISGIQTSLVHTFKIQIGADPDAPQLTNQLLHVLEGGEEAITSDHLFLKSGNSVNFFYEVIDGPQHGMLIHKGSERAGDLREVEVTEFTNDDILMGQLFYQHDGSETMEDDIPFVASRQREGSASDTSGEEEEEDEEVVRGVFRVSIQPVNDNPPLQVVQKVFHVVRDGHKLLTTNDIAFSDSDSGSTDAQLVLVRYEVPFGRIVFVDDPSLQVFRFTQEDLRMHRVLYVHNGPDQGSIQLQVSDGLHQLTTILEVQASDPFIHIANITVLNVKLGEQLILTASSFGLETNLDVRSEDEIKYHIISQPRWGQILKGGQRMHMFSQQDLVKGMVVYRYIGDRSYKDNFRISVEVNQVVAEGDVEVQVGTTNPEVTLKVIKNEKVYVFQGEAAEIKHENLMVSGKGIFPHEVIYTLSDPPSFGYLVSISTELSSDGSPSLDSIHTFTQEDINQGKILYLHSASEMIPDHMTLQVTAEGGNLQEVEVLLMILPFRVPLEVSELRVDEGGAAALSTSTLKILNEYFLGLHLEFSVLVSPSRGWIVNADRDNATTTSFNWNELEQEQIFYHHDGSETLNDSFIIMANASDINRHSQPVTINVRVQPVNDEVPYVVANKVFNILEGSIANLSSIYLHTVDPDSAPSEVLYSILPPINGEIILRGSTSGVTSFSQEQLDQGQVQFRHKGLLDGGFYFIVSDGENQSSQHFFHIQAIALTIMMETIKNITICPHSLQPITSQHLKAVTNEREVSPHELVYHIDKPPQIGQIMRLESPEAVGITNFTQLEVDSGSIYYQHIASTTPFWMTQDLFTFHVTSLRTVSTPQHLNIKVSFQGPCPLLRTQLWRNTGLQVLEGGFSPITRSILDASNLLANLSSSNYSSHDVVFLITSIPSYGHLSLNGAPLNPELPHFRQSHLEQGSLLYTHKGPEIHEDSFHFKALLWPKSEVFHEFPQDSTIFVISEALNITIISVPKLPPQISPPRAHIQVKPGSFITLTTDHLFVTAPHISPEKIVYTLVSMPHGISLALKNNQSVPISKFTQEDLVKLQLIILANFTAASGPIQMNITAGPQSTALESLPVKVTTIHNTILEVPQASGKSVLTLRNIPLSVESTEQDVLYKVTKLPNHGQLMVGQVPVTEFLGRQVEAGEVSYIFTHFSSSRDEFEYLAHSSTGEEAMGSVTVFVSAMVKLGDKEQWPRGCTVKLRTDVLDASELASHTQSVPEFKVLRQPRGGRLVKFPRIGGKQEGISINGFTQSDLEKGLIGVELWEDGLDGADMRGERFHLELSAKQVPSANITVRFFTIPYNSSYPYSATLLRFPTLLETSSHLKPTTSPTSSKSFKFNTSLIPTTDLISTTSLLSTLRIEPHSNPIPPTIPTTSNYSDNITDLFSLTTENWNSAENFTLNTTQDVPANISWSMEVPTSSPKGGTFLAFMGEHMYSIVLPVCLVLFLLVAGILLFIYLMRRKRMGRHHVQKATTCYTKPENGAAERQTFRPTQQDRDIPLCNIDGQRSNGAGGQNQPGSQYWV